MLAVVVSLVATALIVFVIARIVSAGVREVVYGCVVLMMWPLGMIGLVHLVGGSGARGPFAVFLIFSFASLAILSGLRNIEMRGDSRPPND